MTFRTLLPATITMVLIGATALMAQPSTTRFGKTMDGPTHKLAVGAQGHTHIREFTDLPMENGDYSYKLMYEYHEGVGFWQLGAAYAPSVDGVDYVLTPQINLILKDRIYRVGTGALKSRVKRDTGSHWTDVYWQLIAGIGIPLGSRFSLDLYGHYVFERWDSITDSDRGGIEYSALLAFSF